MTRGWGNPDRMLNNLLAVSEEQIPAFAVMAGRIWAAAAGGMELTLGCFRVASAHDLQQANTNTNTNT